MSGDKQIVHRIEEGMNRDDVLATTYQMRNFYRQLGDGFFTTLDVMNYIQHLWIAKLCKANMHVLDVCCGRGLLLPLLRYGTKDLGSYTGVDIAPGNAIYLKQRVTDNKPIEDDYYPFPVYFVESNVAVMGNKLDRKYDLIVYTSSIEHMHPEHGRASLHECRKVITDSGVLIFTCPNTPEDKSGYDTQYPAHVYEWKRSELHRELTNARFKVTSEFGLLLGKRELRAECESAGLGEMFAQLERIVPTEFFVPVLSALFPRASKEIAMIAVPII
jgi:SAM-dependent methyltransferase